MLSSKASSKPTVRRPYTARHQAQKQQRSAQTKHTRLEHLAALDVTSDPISRHMTSIIATLGERTNTTDMIRDLIKAGVNVVRINASCGNEFLSDAVRNVRKVAAELNQQVAIVLDTIGSEIRTGSSWNHEPIPLKPDQPVYLTTDLDKKEDSNSREIYISYKKILTQLVSGQRIYLNDGQMSLIVDRVQGLEVACVVEFGGELPANSRVNFVGVDVDLPGVTDRDADDIDYACDLGVDFIFASFMRQPSHITEVRDVIGSRHCGVIAKIENQEGLRNASLLIDEADGVMIARGDLALELPGEKVFLAQKKLLATANMKGKPAIIATQMLDSMTTNPRPTRAEASDVANAVLDGVDSVTLSTETSHGDYPVESVAMMKSIIIEAEASLFYKKIFQEMRMIAPMPFSMTETVASSAVSASLERGTTAIVCLTTTGRSARLLSKYRPPVPILCVVRTDLVARSILLSRGCFPLVYPVPAPVSSWRQNVAGDSDARIEFAIDQAKLMGHCNEGESIVAVQGWTDGAGHTNTMRILPVD